MKYHISTKCSGVEDILTSKMEILVFKTIMASLRKFYEIDKDYKKFIEDKKFKQKILRLFKKSGKRIYKIYQQNLNDQKT